MRDLPRGAWPVCGEADHGLGISREERALIRQDLEQLVEGKKLAGANR